MKWMYQFLLNEWMNWIDMWGTVSELVCTSFLFQLILPLLQYLLHKWYIFDVMYGNIIYSAKYLKIKKKKKEKCLKKQQKVLQDDDEEEEEESIDKQ